MNFVNVWIAFRATDHNEMNNLRGQEQSGASDLVMNFINGQLDPAVVQNLYAKRRQGPNTWHLWSIVLSDADGPYNHQINDFRQAYPGCQVLGCWHPDGLQLRDENGAIQYEQPDFLLKFMPDVWNGDEPPTYSPAVTVTDINLPAGWQPREFS